VDTAVDPRSPIVPPAVLAGGSAEPVALPATRFSGDVVAALRPEAPMTAPAPVRHGDPTRPTAVDQHGPVLCFYDWLHTATAGEEDENGHVSNVSYVRWIQDAARAHTDAVGWDRRAYEAVGGTFIVKRHEVDYKRGCHAGDDVVATTCVEECRLASAIRRTRVVRIKDGAEILRARTEWVFVSIDGHRPNRIPQGVLEAFALVGRLSRGPRERASAAV
jgi:acyl-CoA thioester hydrolase